MFILVLVTHIRSCEISPQKGCRMKCEQNSTEKKISPQRALEFNFMYMLKSTDKKERLSYDLLERTRMYILCICHTGYLPHKIYTKKEKENEKWCTYFVFTTQDIYHTRYIQTQQTKKELSSKSHTIFLKKKNMMYIRCIYNRNEGEKGKRALECMGFLFSFLNKNNKNYFFLIFLFWTKKMCHKKKSVL